jgi:hypothetical protein
MRRFALPIALGVLVVSVAPVLADGGLPEIGTLRAGPFTATLHNDAATLVTGSNTLTVEVPSLPDRHAVSLSLTGPSGERVDVPLRPVQVLDGPPDGHSHDMAGMGGGHDMAAMGGGHDMTSMGGHDMSGMAAGGAETYRGRGSISVPEAGSWQAHLVIRAAAGASFVAEAPLNAEDGGPNGLYLAGAGTLMGGFVVYGAIQRRRQARVPLTTR